MKKTLIFCLILLIVLILRFVHFYSTRPVFHEGQKLVLEFTLLDEPKITQYGQTLILDNIKIYAPKYPEYHYGDSLKISGILSTTQIASNQSKRMIVNDDRLVMKNPKIKPVKNKKSDLLALPSFIRQKVTEVFNLYLGKNEADLLLGIVFGIKGNLDGTFYTSLKNTGVMHVVAASGMNVSMTGGFLLGIFLLFLERRIAIFATILGIIFYAVLSGLEPSIIRAALMAGFAYFAMLIGRQNYTYLSLFFAAFVMLFITPGLVSDVGFQLSFLATIGILTIQPLVQMFLQRLFYRNHKVVEGQVQHDRLRDLGIAGDFTTTVSAQIGTLPVLMSSFGSFSLLSVFVNVLVLWTIPILMVFGAAGALFALVSADLASVFLYLAFPFLLYFEKIVIFAGNIIQPMIIDDFPLSLVAGYYLILISFVIYINKNKSKHKRLDKH